jgi:LacI family transcriptional regulator
MVKQMRNPKSDRPTVADVAAAAGVSVATVDRVINNRRPVRAKTVLRVREAAETVGYYAVELIRKRSITTRSAMTFGFILQRHSIQFYESLGAALEHATRSSQTIDGRPVIEYLDDLRPSSVAERLKQMAKRVDAIALVAGDHPLVSRTIAELSEQGTQVVALLSDLSAPARAAYVGVDWRKAGRTVGWAMCNLTKTAGHIAIIIGSHRYLATEVCEISFRTYLREHGSHLQLLEPLVNFEEPRFAYQGTLDLLQMTPDLVGIYMVGGGVEGVMEALRETGAAQRITTICHDLTDNTREGLIDGVLDFLIHQPRESMASVTVDMLSQAVMATRNAANRASLNDIGAPGGTAGHSPIQNIIPMELYTVENI